MNVAVKFDIGSIFDSIMDRDGTNKDTNNNNNNNTDNDKNQNNSNDEKSQTNENNPFGVCIKGYKIYSLII